MEIIKTILYTLIIFLLYLIFAQLNIIIENKQENFTYKDGVILYELCKKKSWSQTNFILKSYWENDDSRFKEYLLNK